MIPPDYAARLADVFARVYADTRSLEDAVSAVVMTDREARVPWSSPPVANPKTVIQAVCKAHGLRPGQVIAGARPGGRRRHGDTPEVVRARHVAAQLLADTGMGRPSIARALGLVSHASVYYALDRVKADPRLAADVDDMRERLWGAGKQEAA